MSYERNYKEEIESLQSCVKELSEENKILKKENENLKELIRDIKNHAGYIEYIINKTIK